MNRTMPMLRCAALLAAICLAAAADYTEPTKALGQLSFGQQISSEKTKVTVPSGRIISGKNDTSTLITWGAGVKLAPQPRAMGFPGTVVKGKDKQAGAHTGYFTGTWATDGKGDHELTWDMSTNGILGCVFTVKKVSLDVGTSATLVVDPDPKNHDVHTASAHHFSIVNGTGLSATPSTYDCKNDSPPWNLKITASAEAKPGTYDVTIDGKPFNQRITVTKGCEFDLAATTANGGKDKLYFRFPGTSATVTATLTSKSKNCPGTHTLTVSGGDDPLTWTVTCPKKGGSVSQTIDAFPLKAATYAASIAASSKSAIFVDNDRETINNHIAKIPTGVELGSVVTGESTIAQVGSTTLTVTGSAGAWTATIGANFSITYSTGDIVNDLKPGRKYAWAPAEIAKAPDDEPTQWQTQIDKVQTHEDGHVNTWKKVQQTFGASVSLTGIGTAAAQPDAVAAARAQVEAKRVALRAQIEKADDAAQDTYHATVGTTTPLVGIPGRE